jgi:hypothetical protein
MRNRAVASEATTAKTVCPRLRFTQLLGGAMRYEVELKRVEVKSVEVFASSPEEAVRIATENQSGFKAEYVTERISEDEDGDCHAVVGHCEACSKALLDNGYRSDCEGVAFCFKCFAAFVADESAST